MHQEQESELTNYPHGRGYGHDYMRGGEVFGGYGYSQREEYSRTRGEIGSDAESPEDEIITPPSRQVS
jgi:hypothetical protein